MFIRWKRRKLKSMPGYTLEAIVVCGKRDGLKVRQIFIKQLTSIQENHKDKLEFRIRFWARADRAFDSLVLDPELRKSLEGQLLTKVPKPEEHEKNILEKKLKLELKNFWEKMDKKIAEQESKENYEKSSAK